MNEWYENGETEGSLLLLLFFQSAEFNDAGLMVFDETAIKNEWSSSAREEQRERGMAEFEENEIEFDAQSFWLNYSKLFGIQFNARIRDTIL